MSSGITFQDHHEAYEYAERMRGEGHITRTIADSGKFTVVLIGKAGAQSERRAESKEEFIQDNLRKMRDPKAREIMSGYAKIAHGRVSDLEINRTANLIREILKSRKEDIISVSAFHSPEETSQMIDKAIKRLDPSSSRSEKVLAIDYAIHKIHDGMLEEFIAPGDEDEVVNILNALRHE